MQIAEGICKAVVQKLGHLLALLVGKTGIATVGLRILDIYLLMCHVQVAADHHSLLGIQSLQELAEIIFPGHTVIQSFQLGLGVRGVAGYEIEVVILQGDDSSFVVVLLHAHTVAHAQWLVAGIDGCARISLLLGIVPVAFVAIELQVELTFLHLGLLQAEEVGIERLELALEVLAHASTQAIHVPGYKLHITLNFEL